MTAKMIHFKSPEKKKVLSISCQSKINVLFLFISDEPVCGDPCNGNGQCINDPDNEDYTCSCFSGYSGDGCLTGLGSC